MRHCPALFLLLLISWSGWAQKSKPEAPIQAARLELPLETYFSDVQVQPLPADSSVLLLVRRDLPVFQRGSVYTLQKYDHQLKPRWNRPLEVPPEFNLRATAAEGGMFYTLFQSDLLAHRLWVAAIDATTGQASSYSFETKLVKDVYDLKSVGGNLFVTVLVENHLTVLLLDVAAGKFELLPAVYEPLPAQLSFLADSAARRAEFVMSQTNGYKMRLQIKQLSERGQLLRSEFVQAESERGLITAQISPAAPDSASGRLLAGTYTLRDPRYAQGLFAADLAEGVTPTGSRRSLRFYDFANLKHFFDFMSPGRAARMRQRSQQLRATDRVLRLRYRTLIHDLLPFEGGYVLVAEVYYPYYQGNSFGSGFNRTPFYFPSYRYTPLTTNPGRVDAYHVTHALVCGFDSRGNLLWDNTFVLKDVTRFNLEETVRLRPLPDGKRLALAYLDEDKLSYKIIDHSAPSPNDLSVNLRVAALPTARDKATSTSHEGLLTWYGGRFLAYGYQHIRPERGAGREVFFVNVVGFE